jgi:trk system potassium uptake protein TrkA
MKIIILGAGQVGGSLAEHLASEANDITVVDTDGESPARLGDRLDIRTVQGRASIPDRTAPGRSGRCRHAGGRDQQ